MITCLLSTGKITSLSFNVRSHSKVCYHYKCLYCFWFGTNNKQNPLIYYVIYIVNLFQINTTSALTVDAFLNH